LNWRSIGSRLTQSSVTFPMAERDPGIRFCFHSACNRHVRTGQALREPQGGIQSLCLEPDFVEATTGRNQIGFAWSFLRLDKDKDRVSYGVIQRFFHVMNKGTIKRHFDKYIEGTKPPHLLEFSPTTPLPGTGSPASTCDRISGSGREDQRAGHQGRPAVWASSAIRPITSANRGGR
jgi:hypothetical protein